MRDIGCNHAKRAQDYMDLVVAAMMRGRKEFEMVHVRVNIDK